MRQRTIWLTALAAGVGAATALLLDPVAGARRRRRLLDAAGHLRHRTQRMVGRVRRDLGNRTWGVVASTWHRLEGDQPDDVVLIERVHAALGRVVWHPHSITVRASGGYVTLDGPLPAGEEDPPLERGAV